MTILGIVTRDFLNAAENRELAEVLQKFTGFLQKKYFLYKFPLPRPPKQALDTGILFKYRI